MVNVGRFFDHFYTAEVKRSFTGLGLSIAKLLTERMGASPIFIENKMSNLDKLVQK